MDRLRLIKHLQEGNRLAAFHGEIDAASGAHPIERAGAKHRGVEPTGHRQQGIADRLPLQPHRLAVPEEAIVGIGIAGRCVDHARLPVGGAGHDQSVQLFQAPSPLHKLPGEPFQQFRMGRWFPLRAQIVGRGGDAATEVVVPESVDRDPRCQRTGTALCVGEKPGQSQPGMGQRLAVVSHEQVRLGLIADRCRPHKPRLCLLPLAPHLSPREHKHIPTATAGGIDLYPTLPWFLGIDRFQRIEMGVGLRIELAQPTHHSHPGRLITRHILAGRFQLVCQRGDLSRCLRHCLPLKDHRLRRLRDRAAEPSQTRLARLKIEFEREPGATGETDLPVKLQHRRLIPPRLISG